MYHAFPCGTLALDFVGTLQARRNTEPVERLSSTEMLDAWFTESGMVDDAPAATERDLQAAIRLREAIYGLVAARIGAAAPGESDTAVLNEHAGSAPVRVQLDDGRATRTGTSRQALATLARQAVEILGGDDAALLRECARPECTQVYIDRSRGHRREWCAMATCGNRVKAAHFRARQRGAAGALED